MSLFNKYKKISLLLGILVILFGSFVFTGKVSAKATIVTPDMTFTEAKSKIDLYVNDVLPKIEDNKKLKEEKKKVVKTDGVTSANIEAYRKEFDDFNKKIADNDEYIKNRKDLCIELLAFMGEKASSDTERADVATYVTKINGGFDETAEGESPPCWSLVGGFNIGICSIQAMSWVSSFVIYVFGTILYIAGALFDVSIMLSIEWMSWVFSSSGVEKAWILMRDFANIFFVFILLYISIGTIFNLQGVSNKLQNTIVSVVIIALLVNFSGFFVRVVVDASNIVADEFYTASKDMGGVSDNLGSSLVKKLAPEGYLISKGEGFEDKGKIKAQSLFGLLIEMIFGILTIIVASFVLLVASILFIIRTIVLLFIYVVSPFAFMSRIMPNKKFDYFDKWKDSLIQQSLLAPGFLVPLYLVFLILEGDILGGKLTEMKGSLDVLASGSGGVALNGIIILGLLIACIFIAQSFKAVGLSLATGAAGKANSLGVRSLGGVSRLGGRQIDRLAGGHISGAASSISSGVGKATDKVGWNSAWVRDNIRETGAGKKIGQAIKNPLLTTNDLIGAGAGLAGVKGFDVFGSSAESRKSAKDKEKEKKKEEKEKKEEDKEKEKKDRNDKLKVASQTDAATILGGMTDEQIKEVPTETIVRPEIVLNLGHDELTAINKAGKLTKDQKKIIKHIVTNTPPDGTGVLGTAEAVTFMTGGAGSSWPS